MLNEQRERKMKLKIYIDVTSRCIGRAVLCCIATVATSVNAGERVAAAPAPPDAGGVVHLPAISLPESSFMTEAARDALKRARESQQSMVTLADGCPSLETASAAQAPMIRKCEAKSYYKSASYGRLREVYPVTVRSQEIGGVDTEVFIPSEGVSLKNRDRVLINMHGGGFLMGARTISHIESIPIASVGKVKVVSIDYRQAPEHAFPAASEDVASVYRALLGTYKSGNIGFYGCSAGGLLTAEAVAWLQKESLPMPGAIGMFCEGAAYWTEGDSGQVGKVLEGGIIWGNTTDNPYFRATDPDNPLAFPARSTAVMRKFPPSLLIAATRDPALSSVVQTHSILVAQGVDAELHIWEGLGHAFFFDPDLPQSREVYAVVTKFFEAHLGSH